MASQSPLGLPPITPQLKAITPYLQRAHEILRQDPIMAYWSAYYGCQLGIGLQAQSKDNDSRAVLGALLGVLEQIKGKIGRHDAVDEAAASTAYIENFGMKIFALADNEDRSGNANRSTAKKFLAAANFLEVLKVFPEIEPAEGIQEKIRYAKWKAADIAKAFREGRKPTAGPAGAEVQHDHATVTEIPSPPSTKPTEPRKRSSSVSSREKRSSPHRSSHGDVTPPSRPRASSRASPPRIDLTEAPRRSSKSISPKRTSPRNTHLGVNVDGHEKLGWAGEGEATPGSWSTAATPGTGNLTPATPVQDLAQHPSPTRAHHEAAFNPTQHSKVGSSSSSIRSRSNSNASGYPLPPGRPASDESSGSGSSQKSVRFTPSTVGGDGESSVGYSSAPTSPDPDLGHSEGYYSARPVDIYQPHPILPPIDPTILPPGFVPHSHQPFIPSGVSPQPHVAPPQAPVLSNGHAPSITPPMNKRSPVGYPTNNPPVQHQPTGSSKTPSPVNELSPQIIAKAQKHCRFAISALDYDDAEQARKELRAALAILGG